jgi:outer membrane protein OmpA-like peptidoglycan-associated protein
MKHGSVYLLFLVFQLLIILSCGSAKTTTNPSKNAVDKAYHQLQRGQYVEAEKSFVSLLNNHATSPKVVLGLIRVYTDTQQPNKAIDLLQRSIDNSDSPIYHSVLGSIYRDKGELTLAYDEYKLYQSGISPENENYTRVQKQLDQLTYALSLLAHPAELNIQPLSSDINTKNSEYQPRFTFDQSTIVFTRKIRGQEDIYAAVQQDTSLSVDPIDVINTPYNEGSQSISGDGRYMVFTHCNEDYGYGSCDLYESVFIDGQWLKPRNLGSRVNTSYWESHPSISANGDELYFASNRPGGLGESDIWVSRRDTLGWSSPVNLGAPINTIGKEESPFIHPDNRSLYFRSTGHLGIGSYDIFLSRKLESEWQNPLNLGAPINSIGADGDMVVSLDGKTGYFASDAFDNIKMDHQDIYSFDLPKAFQPNPMTFVKGIVRSKISQLPLSATLEIINLSDNQIITKRQLGKEGGFLVAVPVGQALAFYLTAPNHAFYSEHIFYKEARSAKNSYSEIIDLIPIDSKPDSNPEENPIKLSNIFFSSGSDQLLKESDAEIEQLYDFLISNPVSIRIIGHTDDVGNEEENLILSEKRALAVKNKLLLKGIDPSRIQTQGLGETLPVASNNTDAGRTLNRRTEFVIIKQ